MLEIIHFKLSIIYLKLSIIQFVVYNRRFEMYNRHLKCTVYRVEIIHFKLSIIHLNLLIIQIDVKTATQLVWLNRFRFCEFLFVSHAQNVYISKKIKTNHLL